MRSIITMLTILIGLFFLSYCTGNKEKAEGQAQDTTTQQSDQQLVARGEYLVTIGGCHDCHSPKNVSQTGFEIIKETALSGFPANRPVMKVNKGALQPGQILFNEDFTHYIGGWGASFSANLTSDATGTGNWTEEQFKKALTEGKYKGMDGGRMLLPPMPWQNFSIMTDEDVKAIFMYLKSTTPVQNIVPAPIPPDAL